MDGDLKLTVVSTKTALSVDRRLWKKLLQNCHVHPEHSSELLVGGVVVKVHAAGGVDLLPGAELRRRLDRILFADV